MLQIIIGQYARVRYVPERSKTLTETVRRYKEFLPGRGVLPHPGPRNVRWFGANPWFGAEVVPALRERVGEAAHPTGTESVTD
jgi:uracil-DNA glycosylase